MRPTIIDSDLSYKNVKSLIKLIEGIHVLEVGSKTTIGDSKFVFTKNIAGVKLNYHH